jgi:hypothetical protein
MGRAWRLRCLGEQKPSRRLIWCPLWTIYSALDDQQERPRGRRPPSPTDWRCGSGGQPVRCGRRFGFARSRSRFAIGPATPVARRPVLPQVVRFGSERQPEPGARVVGGAAARVLAPASAKLARRAARDALGSRCDHAPRRDEATKGIVEAPMAPVRRGPGVRFNPVAPMDESRAPSGPRLALTATVTPI